MISKILNFLLNKLLGARRRYSTLLEVEESSSFLPSFSIKGIPDALIKRVTVGYKSLIGASIVFEDECGTVNIGNRVYIGSSTIICRSNITFEDDILVAWGVTFYDHDSHSLNHLNRRKDIEQVLIDFNSKSSDFLKNKSWTDVKSKPIRICKDAWIGAESFILKGVTVGEGAIVAARSVVTKDVAPFTVVAGNPAKIVKQLNQT